jgi:CubicO group peptidase (beta-lactamase class C family)
LELRTLQDYVKLYGERGLAFDPGSRWEYSNYGFLLLGLVVEKASGQNYYDYVREHIFKPAGMNSTDSLPEEQTVTDRSVGYTRMNGAGESSNVDTLPYRGTSAGGGYSTVTDLLAFANALASDKLLDAKHVDLLTAGKVEMPGGGSKYAYGFGDEISADGVHCFGHGGGAPGMNGDLKICPQSGYVVAVLANLDPQAAGHASDFITARLPKE